MLSKNNYKFPSKQTWISDGTDSLYSTDSNFFDD